MGFLNCSDDSDAFAAILGSLATLCAWICIPYVSVWLPSLSGSFGQVRTSNW